MRGATRSAILLALFTAGCKTCDLVEAELRHQTDRVVQLESELRQRDAEIATLNATLENLSTPASAPTGAKPPEQIYLEEGISRISLTTTTGGKDLDRDGVDDAMQIGITPRDYDDDPFKCPGDVMINAYEILPNGLKRGIGVWEIEHESLRESWRSTLIAQGYIVVIPWQNKPKHSKLRLRVRFTAAGDRPFEIEKDVSISLTARTTTSQDFKRFGDRSGTSIRAPVTPAVESKTRPWQLPASARKRSHKISARQIHPPIPPSMRLEPATEPIRPDSKHDHRPARAASNAPPKPISVPAADLLQTRPKPARLPNWNVAAIPAVPATIITPQPTQADAVVEPIQQVSHEESSGSLATPIAIELVQ